MVSFCTRGAFLCTWLGIPVNLIIQLGLIEAGETSIGGKAGGCIIYLLLAGIFYQVAIGEVGFVGYEL
jgi:hypothetical protein